MSRGRVGFRPMSTPSLMFCHLSSPSALSGTHLPLPHRDAFVCVPLSASLTEPMVAFEREREREREREEGESSLVLVPLLLTHSC